MDDHRHRSFDAPDLDEPLAVLSRRRREPRRRPLGARPPSRELLQAGPSTTKTMRRPIAWATSAMPNTADGSRMPKLACARTGNASRAIRGLSLDEALLAMRAAWDRMAAQGQSAPEPDRPSRFVGLFRRYVRNPSFNPGLRLMR